MERGGGGSAVALKMPDFKLNLRQLNGEIVYFVWRVLKASTDAYQTDSDGNIGCKREECWVAQASRIRHSVCCVNLNLIGSGYSDDGWDSCLAFSFHIKITCRRKILRSFVYLLGVCDIRIWTEWWETVQAHRGCGRRYGNIHYDDDDN